MKIAITGSTGFVGSHVVELFSQEYEVLAFNRQRDCEIGNIRYVNWDLRKPCEGNWDFDVLIHCAADTGYEKSKSEMIENNVLSNKNVLDLVHRSGCKHFIYVSSSSVYQGLSGVIDEKVEIDEGNLTNSYSLTKYLAEKYIKEHLDETIKLTILRPRAIYGKGDRILEPSILKYKICNKLILLGNGKNITSLTSIENFIGFIEQVIRNQQTNFEILNVSDPETKTMGEIYSEIAEKHKLHGIIKVPIFIIRTLSFLNKNKMSYLIDSFGRDKILNICKMASMNGGQ